MTARHAVRAGPATRTRESVRAPTRESVRGPAHAAGARVAAELRRVEDALGDGVVRVEGAELPVSHLGKRFFPASGATKGDLMRYYALVAPTMLPAIARRPLVLKRYPDGVSGASFYQQRAPAGVPGGVCVERVDGRPRFIGGSLATLLYTVQLGAISVDPWHARVGSLGCADYTIIDLDPGPRAPFARVVEVALWVHEVLRELGLHGVPKTSGASGMHIVLPLVPGTPEAAARLAAELVATTVAARHPRAATVERAVRARPAGAVYVDYLQNVRGKTVAAVYSVRATPEATVSAPLTWREVSDGLDPRAFDLTTMPRRLARRGDLYAAGMRTCNDLGELVGSRRARRRAGA